MNCINCDSNKQIGYIFKDHNHICVECLDNVLDEFYTKNKIEKTINDNINTKYIYMNGIKQKLKKEKFEELKKLHNGKDFYSDKDGIYLNIINKKQKNMEDERMKKEINILNLINYALKGCKNEIEHYEKIYDKTYNEWDEYFVKGTKKDYEQILRIYQNILEGVFYFNIGNNSVIDHVEGINKINFIDGKLYIYK